MRLLLNFVLIRYLFDVTRLSKYHDKRLAWNSPLPLNTNKLKLTDMCQGLYVVCGARKAVNERLYHWHADIVVDGELARPGVLLKDSWVLIKRTCLKCAYDKRPTTQPVTEILGF